MDLLTWALVALVLLLVLYKLGTWNYDFFSAKGVKNWTTFPFLGSMADMALKRKATALVIEDIFKEYPNERFVGFFMFRNPILIIKDPELIKRITVKDFEHFVDHQQTFTEGAESLLSKSLSILRGEKWHNMRGTLSPVFTSSKMKNMFHLMNECGKQVGDYLQREIDNQGTDKPYTLEMKDLFTRFTSDVIATAAFGIHVDSLKEKENHFYSMGKQLTNFKGIKNLKFLGFMLAPKLMKLFGIGFFNKTEKNFFFDLVRQTISTREKEGIVRPDLIHLLMQARKGELKTEGDDEEEISAPKSKRIELTEEDIVAQAMIFFFAGFETSSNLLSFAVMLLAVHEDVQRKLQEEIDEVLPNEKAMTYENVNKMKYLDMVISETLRVYPPALMSDRLCTKDFVIPETESNPEYVIKKGEVVWIPIYAFQHNPEYFPEPKKFDPERFSDENKHKIIPYTYIPFGVGPRVCIGQRFALLEVKVALVHLLSRFNLVVVEKTPLPLRLSKHSFVMALEGGYWLGVTPRQKA